MVINDDVAESVANCLKNLINLDTLLLDFYGYSSIADEGFSRISESISKLYKLK